jgi:hypothetical protein
LKVARLALHSVEDEEKLVLSQMKEEELALELRQDEMVDVRLRWRAAMAQVVNVRKALELLGIPVPKAEHSSPPSAPMLMHDKEESGNKDTDKSEEYQQVFSLYCRSPSPRHQESSPFKSGDLPAPSTSQLSSDSLPEFPLLPTSIPRSSSPSYSSIA